MNVILENRRKKASLKRSPEKTLNEIISDFKNKFSDLIIEIKKESKTELEKFSDSLTLTQAVKDIASSSARKEIKDTKDIFINTSKKIVDEVEQYKNSTLDELSKTLEDKKKSLLKLISSEKDNIIKDTMLKITECINVFEKQLDSKIEEITEKISAIQEIEIPTPENGKNAEPADVVPLVMKELKSLFPKDSVTLSDVEELLKAQAAEFMKIIDRLQTSIKQRNKGGGSAGGGGGDIIRIDSFYGNGVNKAFTLTQAPRTISKIMVHCSDFPNIYRPTVDFTISGKTLTLTAEVDAPSDSATFIVQYVV